MDDMVFQRPEDKNETQNIEGEKKRQKRDQRQEDKDKTEDWEREKKGGKE